MADFLNLSWTWPPLTMTERPPDLVLVHSIPSGVLGIARYFDGAAAMTSWVGQLGNRRVPESMETLASGRTCISFLKIHEVGASAPEEDWLRANAAVLAKGGWAPGILSNSVQRKRKLLTFHNVGKQLVAAMHSPGSGCWRVVE